MDMADLVNETRIDLMHSSIHLAFVFAIIYTFYEIILTNCC